MTSLSHVSILILLFILRLYVDCYSQLNCDPNVESMFVEDPTDRQAFFSCRPYGNYPSLGFWSRHYCPNDMHFEYNSQQCTTDSLPPNTVREANDLLRIAILNGSCAHGEQCIGGTVCDPYQQRCLCPYGTVALLENLFCAKLSPPVNDVQQPYTYSGQYSSQVPLQPLKSTQGIETSLSPSLSSQVPLGSYCDHDSCEDGATCVNSVCICPGKTQNNGTTNCTLTSSNIPQTNEQQIIGQQGSFFKAKLGEQCNEYLGLFCADQSSMCVNGYCQCVPPMVEQQGQCQMPLVREAGPGELCNSGQVCTKGSVCNQQIPLCVCPKGTELVKGKCVERDLHKENEEEEKKISLTSTQPTTTSKFRPLKIEAKVGEKCSLNADCESGAYCNGNTKPPTCQCLSTHININNRCEKIVYPGQKGCEVDLQCSAGYAGARCLNNQCVCPPGSSPIEQTCIPGICKQPPLKLIKKQCLLNKNKEEEEENFFKIKRRKIEKIKKRRRRRRKKRKLKDEKKDEKNKEGKFPLVGQLCPDKKCSKGAKCLNGVCACLEGYNLFHGQCLPPRASQGGINNFHKHSLLFLPNFPLMDSSTINSKYKEIKREEIEEEEEDPLQTKTLIAGSPCRLSLECPYRTECLRGVCRCKRGETIVNGVCRRAIHEVFPGGRCDTQNGVDCVGESHCFYGICVCLYGLIIAGQECANSSSLKSVRPGEKCLLGQRCTGRSRCVRSICQCPKGQEPDTIGDKGCFTPSKKFLNIEMDHQEVKEGEEEENIQKLPNFVYTIPAALAAAGEGAGKFNQILTANQMSINLMDTKSLRSFLGPFLRKYERDGEDEEELNSENCKGPICRQIYSPNLVSISKSKIPSFLSTNAPSHSDIPKIVFETSTHKLLVGIPGTPCGTSLNGQPTFCSGGAICLGGICVCRPGFVPLNGLCQISKVQVGKRCFINEQCKDNGICINGFCRCQNDLKNKTKINLINSFHRLKCEEKINQLSLASVGDDCSKGQRCGFNSICGMFSKVCECPIGMERNKSICIAATKPRGNQCISSSDCTFHAFCDNGYCLCLSSYYPIGDYCLPPALAIEEDLKAFIDPDLIELILKGKNNNKEGDKVNYIKREVNKSEELFKWKMMRRRRFKRSFEQKQIGNSNKTLMPPKMPQLSSTFTTNNEKEEETFDSETVPLKSLPEVKREENGKEKISAAPGTQCGPLDVCTGGSTCVEGLCLCPAGTRPSIKTGNCETFEQRKTLIREENNVKEYSKYTSKVPKMQPGPIDRSYARPSESCANREICTGGSICQNSNKVCECPPNKQILRNHICIQSDEPPMLKVVNALPGEKCNSETSCEGESICVEGTCRCQNNEFTPKSGTCKRRSVDLENSFYDNILPPIQLPEESEIIEVNNQLPQHPRISGPPLKKQQQHSLISDILPEFTKTEPLEKGICPPGNSPTISRSTGQLIKCNGMTPNCPPKSYCFVTGEASETYNCCKSY